VPGKLRKEILTRVTSLASGHFIDSPNFPFCDSGHRKEGIKASKMKMAGPAEAGLAPLRFSGPPFFSGIAHFFPLQTFG